MGLVSSIVEFLIGFFIAPFVLMAIAFLVFYIFPGFITYSSIIGIVLKVLILIVLFLTRKMIAIGFLVDLILDNFGIQLLSLILSLINYFQ